MRPLTRTAAQRAKTPLQALLGVGIKNVEPDAGEFDDIRAAMEDTNTRMAQRGMFSADLLDEMRRHVEEFRTTNGGS